MTKVDTHARKTAASESASVPVSQVVRRRRLWSFCVAVGVVGALLFAGGHRGVHAVRSVIVPGAGLYDHRHWTLGAAFTLAAVASTIGWIRWGVDWLVGAVTVASMIAAAALAYNEHPTQLRQLSRAAHEFPLVIVVMGALSGVRLLWRRSPIGRWHVSRSRAAGRMGLSLVDQCRARSIEALAALDSSIHRASRDEPSNERLSVHVPSENAAASFERSSALASSTAADVDVDVDVDLLRRRCRRIGIAARGRFRGDPFRTDHAHARTALLLMGLLNAREVAQFRNDADRALNGVPSSEPGWIRLLDGTLAACAFQLGLAEPTAVPGSGAEGSGLCGVERWSAALNGSFALRHGHRPGACWTPLALRGPRANVWEHAAATGLARAAGWIHANDDWNAVRTRAFAAAARGNHLVDDERLVAAGRIWLTFVEDEQASQILGRVTIRHDRIALALNALAVSLRANPSPVWQQGNGLGQGAADPDHSSN
jgi:hypothetical protein